MILQACVILFTGGEVCLSACWDTIPPGAAPPPQSRHPQSRACWEIRSISGQYWNATFLIFTARKCSLRRLCFYRCLSVHRGEQTPPGPDTPPNQTPPGPDTPLEPGTPLGLSTPPRTKYIPRDMVNAWAVCILLECKLVILQFHPGMRK